MKTLNEMINNMAESMFHQYMGGSNQVTAEGCYAVAEIFEVDPIALNRTVDKKYKEIKTNYYKTVNKESGV